MQETVIEQVNVYYRVKRTTKESTRDKATTTTKIERPDVSLALILPIELYAEVVEAIEAYENAKSAK